MYLNIVIVFLVSAFWHGANWTFIIWGALHAAFIIGYMLKKRFLSFPSLNNKLFNIGSILFTFLLVSVGWIFFRANNVSDAILIVKKIFTGGSIANFELTVTNLTSKVEFGITSTIIALLMTGLMLVAEYYLPPDLSTINKRPVIDIFFCSLILVLIICFGIFSNASFIYFQF